MAQPREQYLYVNVLHVYRTYFPDTQGGLEEVIRQLCAGVKELGAKCMVLTTTKERNAPTVIKVDNATVVRTKELFEIASCNVSLASLSEYKKLAQWADLIHFHFPWPFADVLNLMAPSDKPTVITYHSDIVRQKFLLKLYKPLMAHFLGSADRIVCTSPNYFATSDALSDLANKVDVIPIGLDRNSYPEPSESSLRETKQAYGEDFFLFVGVLRYYKGLHILLRAIQDAPFRVVIVGSGPTEHQLMRLADELELKNVIFTGHVSDEVKVCLFELSRAIVFPSYLRAEAFGVTLLEGAMRGKPLISTEVGSGTSHVNIHGETGIVVAPGSPRTLRQAMDQLYERPDLARLMGARAKQRFDKLFNGKLMARRYWELYSELLTGPKDQVHTPETKTTCRK